MKKANRHRRGLTLVEMLAVLFILALVAGVAVTATEGWVDQSRFEAAQRLLADIEVAILGSRDAREPDGTLVVTGFVADMGRLPRTTGTDPLVLSELWDMPLSFDLRPATAENLSDPSHADPEVIVPCGWRGPYLRLPLGAADLKDPWGKRLVSPVAPSDPPDPDGADYAHLRSAADVPLTSAGQDVGLIRLLGANGRRSDADQRYDRDTHLWIPDVRYRTHLAGKVSVRGATPDAADTVVIKVFGPDPAAPGKIGVVATPPLAFNGTSDYREFALSGLTIGPRVVRAYFSDGGATTSPYARSAVLRMTLLPGSNAKDVVIDRP